MIKSFCCDNFRNISTPELEFKRINILIGANNAGKSNFIRALSFAANMVNHPNAETTGFLSELKRNGWDSIVNKRNNQSEFELVWNFDLKIKRINHVAYTLRTHVGKLREDNYIAKESLDSAHIRSGKSKAYNFFSCHSDIPGQGKFSTAGESNKPNKLLKADVDQYESVLLQMDKLFFSHKELFSSPFVRDDIREVLKSMRAYFHSFYAYSCTAFNLAAIREMQDEQNDGLSLKKDGSNFVNVFARAQEKNPSFKEDYCRILRRLVSNCEDIRISNANGKIWMNLCIQGVEFPLSEVSDGTVHLLLLLLLLTLPEDSGISMLSIDEPEMNLHPSWQKSLAVEILRCDSFQQCFISTHSPDFLDEFTQGFLSEDVAIFVFDPSKKLSIRQLNASELKEDLTEWTLGDLYRIGDPVIGGWPQ